MKLSSFHMDFWWPSYLIRYHLENCFCGFIMKVIIIPYGFLMNLCWATYGQLSTGRSWCALLLYLYLQLLIRDPPPMFCFGKVLQLKPVFISWRATLSALRIVFGKYLVLHDIPSKSILNWIKAIFILIKNLHIFSKTVN